MSVSVKSGDRIGPAIGAYMVSGEYALVALDTGNGNYNLSVEKARELAKALISAADAVEFVRTNDFALP